jgi:hypothetical protein
LKFQPASNINSTDDAGKAPRVTHKSSIKAAAGSGQAEESIDVSNHPKQGPAVPAVPSRHSGAIDAAPAIFGLAIGIALFALASILGLLFSSAVFGYPGGSLA